MSDQDRPRYPHPIPRPPFQHSPTIPKQVNPSQPFQYHRSRDAKEIHNKVEEVPDPVSTVVPRGVLNASKLLGPTLDKFSEELKQRKDPEAVVERLCQLLPAMQHFVQLTRAHEGFLSQAQLSDAKNLVPGTFNYIMHMVAKANEQHNISSQRLSNAQMWRYMLMSLYKESISPDAGSNVYSFPEYFHPACLKDEKGDRVYQVIGFTFNGTPHVGVVLEVYRGAVVQQSKNPAKPLSMFAQHCCESVRNSSIALFVILHFRPHPTTI